jgi:hypothetical protein
LREALTRAAFDEAWNVGRDWPIDHAIRNALSPQGEPALV